MGRKRDPINYSPRKFSRKIGDYINTDVDQTRYIKSMTYWNLRNTMARHFYIAGGSTY